MVNFCQMLEVMKLLQHFSLLSFVLCGSKGIGVSLQGQSMNSAGRKQPVIILAPALPQEICTRSRMPHLPMQIICLQSCFSSEQTSGLKQALQNTEQLRQWVNTARGYRWATDRKQQVCILGNLFQNTRAHKYNWLWKLSQTPNTLLSHLEKIYISNIWGVTDQLN